ncbi:hypothetical protein GGQ74_002884 [Desulfobaculum xiamenense]|uniref:Uncharacterized protein n=1 Tax=Desulfobaculum xiamenense TaxID=995050 RepID=A0A846QPS9_9BACT|nr:hypothetical protein [Desulfobaculum xiamenense]NJB69187.1 hypothetical protein [Desulfobaculum xiamenense]
MTKILNYLTDDLMQEAMVEAAATFFGTRRQIEVEKEAFAQKLEELRGVHERVLERASVFNELLMAPEYVGAFYAAIGVENPGRLLRPERTMPEKFLERWIKRPLTLTRHGAYEKIVHLVYAGLQDRIDEFHNGRFYDDPKGTGRKLVKAYMLQMRNWVERLNTKITRLNTEAPPSETRRFIKSLDPDMLRKEFVMDAPLDGLTMDMDKTMEVECVDASVLDGLALPVLPRPHEVRQVIREQSRVIFDAHEDRIREMLDGWATW